jgi:hypothetical protein|nr:MAG TPA: hypothetical protein [Caudoviricetes sp.]
MDAVVYLQNPVVGKRYKRVFRNIKNIEVVGDQFQFVIDDGEPVHIIIDNDTTIHFYNNYLNQ